ncbi:MAG: efflux RND transporter periplasmic adaptor subunit [Cyanobacteria bacterium J06641_5]
MRSLLPSLLLLFATFAPIPSLAHGGHSHEFEGGGDVDFSTDAIEVEADILERLGILVEAVNSEALEFGLRATGEIAFLPQSRVEVTSPVAGAITRLLVQPGETVRAGQAVAVISSPELAATYIEAQERRADAEVARKQAQAALRLAEENYTQQQQLWSADRSRVQTTVDVVRDRVEKDRMLFENGTIAKQILQESEAQLLAAQSEVTQLESRLSLAEAEGQVQRARTDLEAAQSRLALSGAPYEARLQQLGVEASADGTVTVTAPIAGTIVERGITLGESVSEPGQALMAIADNETVFVTANLHEKDIAQISMGQRARVTVGSLPGETFSGTVTVVGATVATETRTIPVQIEVSNPKGTLKPGMFAELELLDSTATAAVPAIPQSAVLEINGQSQVFVQNGNAFEAVEVDLGRTAGDRVEVLSGLFEGDLIVTQRANQLYAQSLRQGSNASKTAVEEAPETSTGMPWWALVTGGGAIAVGAFAVGMAAGKSRSQPEVATPLLAEGAEPNNLLATAEDAEVRSPDA